MADEGIDKLRQWIGRTESREDLVSPAPVAGLSATLEIAAPETTTGTDLPPLWHWLYFLPVTPTSGVGADGHARKGDFLPPVALPRRMWAGSRIEFVSGLKIGDSVRRESVVKDVQQKSQGDDAKIFVTVRPEIFTGNDLLLTEEQDIVYRNPAPTSSTPASSKPATGTMATWSREVFPDPVLLFRYSALTFNAHKIHYDRDYATREEGYPGLVVHGPLTATLLLDSLHRERPDFDMASLVIRARRPLFDNAGFSIQGRIDDGDATLWAIGQDGQVCMQVTVKGRR